MLPSFIPLIPISIPSQQLTDAPLGRGDHLFVRLDFDANQLTLIRRKVNLSALDNSNGVDVELHVGAAVAVENILLQPAAGHKLEYRITQ